MGIVMVVDRGESAERDDGEVRRAVGRLCGCWRTRKGISMSLCSGSEKLSQSQRSPSCVRPPAIDT